MSGTPIEMLIPRLQTYKGYKDVTRPLPAPLHVGRDHATTRKKKFTDGASIRHYYCNVPVFLGLRGPKVFRFVSQSTGIRVWVENVDGT